MGNNVNVRNKQVKVRIFLQSHTLSIAKKRDKPLIFLLFRYWLWYDISALRGSSRLLLRNPSFPRHRYRCVRFRRGHVQFRATSRHLAAGVRFVAECEPAARGTHPQLRCVRRFDETAGLSQGRNTDLIITIIIMYL